MGGKRLEAVLKEVTHLRDTGVSRQQRAQVDEWYESQELLLKAHGEGVVLGHGKELSAAAVDTLIYTSLSKESGASWLEAVVKNQYEVSAGKLVAIFQGLYRARKNDPARFEAKISVIVQNLRYVLGPFELEAAELGVAIANGVEVCEQWKGAHDGAVASVTSIVGEFPEAKRLRNRLIGDAYACLPRSLVLSLEQVGRSLLRGDFGQQPVLRILS